MSKSETHTYLIESYVIKYTDPRWLVCDHAAWLSKNIYNCANYIMRQAYFADRNTFEKTGQWGTRQQELNYKTLYKAVREQYPQDYRALPKRVANETVKQVVEVWTSYRNALIDYRENPGKYQVKPRLPRYKNKASGRNLVKYEKKAVSRNPAILGKGILKPSQLPIEIEIGPVLERIREIEDLAKETGINLYDYLVEVRSVPRSDCYRVEMVYRVQPRRAASLPELNPDRYYSVSLRLYTIALPCGMICYHVVVKLFTIMRGVSVLISCIMLSNLI